MRPAGILFVALLGLAVPLHGQGSAEPTVVASGTGEVVLRPDRASVFVTIRTVAAEPAEAESRNEATTEAVMAGLAGLSLESDSIRLTALRVGPHREYGRDGPIDAGFEATRSLRVPTEDLGQVGRIVGVVTKAGATSVDYVAYSSSRAPAARLEALDLAVRDARREAEAMAAAAGGRIGPLLRLTTGGRASVPTNALARTEMAGGAMPDPEDLTVRAEVEGHWRFLP